MTTNEKTIQEINEKIRNGSVCVVTAAQMTQIVAELGPEDGHAPRRWGQADLPERHQPK